jgi:hypothetical protein
MQVGDLVKVYHFSHTARTAKNWTDRPDDIDAYMLGLVVPKNGTFPNNNYRVVLRCIDGQREPYRVNRLEVIHESR